MTTATFTPVGDVSIRSVAPDDDDAQGTSTYLQWGTVTGKLGGTTHAVLKIDVSSIPAGSTVSAAPLAFNANVERNNSGGLPTHIYRLTQAGYDATSPNPQAASWNSYYVPNNSTLTGRLNWAAAGGDFTTTTPAGVAFTGPSATGVFSVDIATLVQDAIDNRSGLLFLLIHNDVDSPGVITQLESVDSIERTTPPLLTVTYSTGHPRSFAVIL